MYTNPEHHNWCGLAIVSPKLSGNVGTLFRAAACLGCTNFHATIGERYRTFHSDVVESPKVVPTFRFETWSTFLDGKPKHACLVGVEMTDSAVDLVDFAHPDRAVYLLGSEDHGLPPEVLRSCDHVVRLPSAIGISMNVSTAGTAVLWDRLLKQSFQEE